MPSNKRRPILYLILALVLSGIAYGALKYFGIVTKTGFINECFNRQEEKLGKLSMDMSEKERAQMVEACATEIEKGQK